ncbi:MAG: hypothetical protein ACJ79S_04065 [Gemmatimonadaceae bacterium]
MPFLFSNRLAERLMREPSARHVDSLQPSCLLIHRDAAQSARDMRRMATSTDAHRHRRRLTRVSSSALSTSDGHVSRGAPSNEARLILQF